MRKIAVPVGIFLCVLFMRPVSFFARQSLGLKDPATRNGILEKIAGLVESKYVLADILHPGSMPTSSPSLTTST